MIILFAILLISVGLAVMAYAHYRPAGLPAQTYTRINVVAAGVAVFGCVGASTWAWYSLRGTPDSAWWPVVASTYSIGVVVLSLVAAALVRAAIARRRAAPNNSLERTRDR